MKDNIPMEGVVELFSSSNIFVDEEGLVSLNDVYRIAIERGLDGVVAVKCAAFQSEKMKGKSE